MSHLETKVQQFIGPETDEVATTLAFERYKIERSRQSYRKISTLTLTAQSQNMCDDAIWGIRVLIAVLHNTSYTQIYTVTVFKVLQILENDFTNSNEVIPLRVRLTKVVNV